MRVKQWRYFWGWAGLCGALLSGCCLLLLMIAPTAYVSRPVFEPVELYPGEDLSPPTAPRGISIEAQSNPDLVWIRSVDRNPQVAATAAETFIDNWSQQRLEQARSTLLAAEAKLEPGSAAARRLEIQRKTLGTVGHVHARAEVSHFPISPNSSFILGGGLAVSAMLSLALASLVTRWRGQRIGDGEDISWTRIGARFWKISSILCPIILLFSGSLFLLQPRAYQSVATVKFLPEEPGSFGTKLALLGSRVTVAAVVREHRPELLQGQTLRTENEAVDLIMKSLEVRGEPGSSTAEVRFTSHHSNLTDLVPAEIVQAFSNRQRHRAHEARGRKFQDLRSMLTVGSADPELIVELNQMIDSLSQAEVQYDTVEIIGLGASEKIPRGWFQWLTEHAWVGLLRGCLWAGILTALSFVGFSRRDRTASPGVSRGTGVRRPIAQALAEPY